MLNHWSDQTLQVADDDQMEMSSPVTPLNPYETPKASKGKRSPRASSGT